MNLIVWLDHQRPLTKKYFFFQLASSENQVSDLESAKSKMSSESTGLNTQIEELEHKIGMLQKNNKSLDNQLNDMKQSYEDELRGKQDAQHKLQQALSELDQVNESLEEEQSAKSDLQNKLSRAVSEASQWRGKYESEGANRVEELEDAKYDQFFVFIIAQCLNCYFAT